MHAYATSQLPHSCNKHAVASCVPVRMEGQAVFIHALMMQGLCHMDAQAALPCVQCSLENNDGPIVWTGRWVTALVVESHELEYLM
jgi:hypothetical protein